MFNIRHISPWLSVMFIILMQPITCPDSITAGSTKESCVESRSMSQSAFLEDNLCVNSGFEDGQAGMPDGWFTYPEPSPAGLTFTWSQDDPHGGGRCAEISNQTAGGVNHAVWHQVIEINEPGSYRCSAYLRTSQEGARANVLVMTRDGDGQDLYPVESIPVFNEPEWVQISTQFILFEDVVEVVIALSIYQDGQVFFDDVRFEQDTGRTWTRYQVNAGAAGGRLKSLRGTNVGPLTPDFDFSQRFSELDIDFMRTHDYYGATDMHEIFPVFDADPQNPANYDFSRSDVFITAAAEAGLAIMFRLGESWENDPVHNVPPTDFDKWADIARHVVMHYNEGWANGFYYDIEYWEIWNEPNIGHFWTGTPQQYYDLYAITAKRLKNHDPGLKIGGPAMAGISNISWWRKLLDHIQASAAPMDFFSWHLYYPWDASAIAEISDYLRKELDHRGMTDCEIINNEWNLYIPYEDFHPWDGEDPLQAAHAASTLAYCHNSAIDRLMYYRTDSPVFGLFHHDGRFTMSGLAYKAYAAFRETPVMLDWEGGDSDGRTLLAAASEDGYAINLLLADCYSNSPGYEVKVKNLPSSAGRRQIFRIDQEHRFMQVDEMDITSSNLTVQNPITAPYVELIRIRLADPSATPQVDVILSDSYFVTNDLFSLSTELTNPGTAMETAFFLLLDCHGVYFFYPSWTTTLDYERKLLPALSSSTETHLEFSWPDGAGAELGILFWGALLNSDMTEILDLDGEVFGYAS